MAVSSAVWAWTCPGADWARACPGASRTAPAIRALAIGALAIGALAKKRRGCVGFWWLNCAGSSWLAFGYWRIDSFGHRRPVTSNEPAAGQQRVYFVPAKRQGTRKGKVRNGGTERDWGPWNWEPWDREPWDRGPWNWEPWDREPWDWEPDRRRGRGPAPTAAAVGCSPQGPIPALRIPFSYPLWRVLQNPKCNDMLLLPTCNTLQRSRVPNTTASAGSASNERRLRTSADFERAPAANDAKLPHFPLHA